MSQGEKLNLMLYRLDSSARQLTLRSAAEAGNRWQCLPCLHLCTYLPLPHLATAAATSPRSHALPHHDRVWKGGVVYLCVFTTFCTTLPNPNTFYYCTVHSDSQTASLTPLTQYNLFHFSLPHPNKPDPSFSLPPLPPSTHCG